MANALNALITQPGMAQNAFVTPDISKPIAPPALHAEITRLGMAQRAPAKKLLLIITISVTAP